MSFITRLKTIRELRKYPTADKNASTLRLLVQGLPYYFCRNGYSFNPLSVFIHVNSNCNLKCKMCDVGQKDETSGFARNLLGDKPGDMPLALFKKIIDDIKSFCPFVSMPATEPLLYPHIGAAISYAKEAGLRVGVATNGYFLPEKAQEIFEAKLDKLIVSIDGTRDIHDGIRGISGTYDRIMKGLAVISKLKKERSSPSPFIYVNYVISELNYHCIADAINAMPLDDITKIDLRVMFYCTEELAKKHNEEFGEKYDATVACLKGGIDLRKIEIEVLCRQLQQVRAAHAEKCAMFFENTPEWLNTYFHRDDVFMDNRGCVFPWFTAQVSQEGDLWGPSRCYHRNYGNLKEANFASLWNGPLMRDFRRDLQRHKRFPACTRCEGVNY